MKYVQTLFCSLAIFLSMFSCNHRISIEKLPLLADIQLLGDTLPTQALLKLDSIKPLFDNESEYLRNKFVLLDIRLHDKAYIKHTSIKPIKEVCSYFEENGTAAEQQEAYYYMGSVYRDLNDYPNAVTYFLKAIDIAESNKDTDAYFLQVSYTQLAYLYSELFDYKEALEAMLKGLNIAETNSTATGRTYMSVAGFYYDLKDTANTILYCTKAMDFVKKEGVRKDNADLVAKAMSSFAKYGYRNDAVSCFDMLNTLKENETPHNYLSAISVYYEECVSVDSAAAIRIKQFENSGDIGTLYNAAKWLTIYYSNKGDYENATKYAILYIRISNTLAKEGNAEAANRAKNRFQYHRDKEEELAIIEMAANNRRLLVIGLSVSVVVIILLIIMYVCRKRYMGNVISKKNADLILVRQRLEQYERELESLKRSNDEYCRRLNEKEAANRKLIEQNSQLAKQNIMSELSGDAMEIVLKFKNASKGKTRLVEEDWQEFLAAIDKLYPDFMYELNEKFKKISTPMLRVCYLWKIKCTNPEIANLTGYPPQTVWDRVKKINELFGK